jgi:hypothetical protein
MIQISLEIPDQPGELLRAVSLLGAKKVDVKALFVTRNAPGPTSGFVRMIVTNPQAAMAALREGGLTPTQEEVVVAAIEDQPGGLATALDALAKVGINVTYAYGFVSRVEGRALAVLGVEDPPRASKTLKEAGIKLVDASAQGDSDLAAFVGGVWNW